MNVIDRQVNSNFVSLSKCLHCSRQGERTELWRKEPLRKAYVRRNSEGKIKSYRKETGCEMGAGEESRNLPFRCLYENYYNHNFFFNPGPSMTLIQPS